MNKMSRTTATEQMAPPMRGWYLSQARPNVMRNMGILTKNAAIKIMMLAVPLRNPPTMGM